jgi:hypothetical protein
MGDTSRADEAYQRVRDAVEHLCEEALANRWRRLEPLEIRALGDQFCERLVALVEARIDARIDDLVRERLRGQMIRDAEIVAELGR